MIVNDILVALKEHLEEEMIAEVDVNDPERIVEVKVGRYQSDPTRSALRLSVMGYDPDDLSITDNIINYSKESTNKLAFWTPAREIGGGEMWLRRGLVQMELFLIPTSTRNYQEPYSREVAYNILGRLHKAICSLNLDELEDDLGERACQIFPYANKMIQSGGPPSSFIWRGKVYWEVLTERDE